MKQLSVNSQHSPVVPQAVSAAPATQAEATVNRRADRLEIARSVSVIPVNAAGFPESDRMTYGVSIDLTLLGIGFLVEANYKLKLSRYVIGIEGDDGLSYYSTAAIRHKRQVAEGQRVGAEFLKGEHDLFRRQNLQCQLNPQTMTLESGLRSETLLAWQALGVLQSTTYDRVSVCPDCGALPTIRNGCKKCGSARVDYQRLIHHYACAHVGFDTEFEDRGSLTCRKCRAHSLVVGADFEYLTGPYICLDCKWSDTTLELFCNCLRCGFRFPTHQAQEQEVIGYSVARLDSLAFFDQS
jgi:hypothetical protein